MTDSDDGTIMSVFELSATPARQDFYPTREQPVPQLKGRGVYIADVRDAAGNPILQAVSRDGRVLSWVPWLPGLDLEQLQTELWRFLDLRDPPLPRLLR